MSKTIEMKRFDLSVIRPIKNKPGELVFEMSVTDESVSKAVAYVQNLVGKDSGLIVLQTASVIRNHVVDPEQRAAILKKLGIYVPEGYDLPKAKLDHIEEVKAVDASANPIGWTMVETSVE
jgi:hypothetical protein